MGTWLVPADLLARSRFQVSPLNETVAALTLLDATGSREARSGCRGSALPRQPPRGVRRHAGCRPGACRAPGNLWRPRRGRSAGWMADFLTLPPLGAGRRSRTSSPSCGPGTTRGCDARSAPCGPGRSRRPWSDRASGRPSPTCCGGCGPPPSPRTGRVAVGCSRPTSSRARRLATQGWAGVVPTLSRRMEWKGGVTCRSTPTTCPPGTCPGPGAVLRAGPQQRAWVSWELPHRFAIVYPVTGAQAPVDRARAGGLARSSGANRARVLDLPRQAPVHDPAGRADRAAPGSGRQPPAGPARRRGGPASTVGTRGAVLAHSAQGTTSSPPGGSGRHQAVGRRFARSRIRSIDPRCALGARLPAAPGHRRARPRQSRTDEGDRGVRDRARWRHPAEGCRGRRHRDRQDRDPVGDSVTLPVVLVVDGEASPPTPRSSARRRSRPRSSVAPRAPRSSSRSTRTRPATRSARVTARSTPRSRSPRSTPDRPTTLRSTKSEDERWHTRRARRPPRTAATPTPSGSVSSASAAGRERRRDHRPPAWHPLPPGQRRRPWR